MTLVGRARGTLTAPIRLWVPNVNKIFAIEELDNFLGERLKMLMRIEVGDWKSEAEQAIELCSELEADVVRVDATGERASQERFPRQHEVSVAADQGWNLGGRQDRWVLADHRKVRAEAERGRVEEVRHEVGEYPAVGKHRRARHDALTMRIENAVAHAGRHSEVVGIHDQQRLVVHAT